MLDNRWFQLGASLLSMIMIANLQYAWTLFVTPMQDSTGWDLAQIQFAFTLFVLCQTWVQPLDGWLIDRLGPRGFISAAGVLCGLGWAGMGYASSPAMLSGLYCVAGVGAAFVYSGSMGSALKWFRRNRGLATGVMAAGFGGGTALFIPVISTLIASHGYQTTFVATGVLQGLVILAIAQVLRHPVEDAPRRERQEASAAAPAAAGLSTPQMLRTPQFYGLFTMFVLMASGGLLVTANAGPIAQSWGLPVAALTLAATVSPLANGASRIFWGWLSDRRGREATMVLAFGLNAICLLLVILLGPRSTGWFVTTLVLVYFTWGEVFALVPSATADYFGTRHVTSNYAVVYTAKGVAAILGGWCAALLYQMSGSWEAGFYGSAAMALGAAAIAWRLRAPASARRAVVPAAARR